MYIPVSVLIAICKAIEADQHASDVSAISVISITPEFALELGIVINEIGDSEIRQWAWNEIKRENYTKEYRESSYKQLVDLRNQVDKLRQRISVSLYIDFREMDW